MTSILASIPSPSSGSIHIGSLQLRAYGLMIALGVIAGAWLLGRRLEERRLGTREDAGSIVTWAVIAGVLGSRAYHVITDWELFRHHPGNIPKIWQGGLGIPGGLLAGIPVGIWRARKRGIASRDIATAAAPTIPLAQAIGRWGNWWNQELFGRPTKLPWALEIDAEHVAKQGLAYPEGTTFHPTFLYESLGNFLICAALLLIDKKRNPRPGRLMAMYLMAYSVLRLGVESLRVDFAHKFLGLRVNTWASIIVFVAAATWLRWDSTRPEPMALAIGGPVADGQTAEVGELEQGPIEDGGEWEGDARATDAAPVDDAPADDAPADVTATEAHDPSE